MFSTRLAGPRARCSVPSCLRILDRSIRYFGALILLGLAHWAAAGEVRLEWDAVADARVAVYEVHYGTQSGQYGAQVEATSNTASVADLQASATYFFAVRACQEDRTLCSSFSNEISATIPYPAPKAGFSANAIAGPAPLTVGFSDSSSGAVESWQWNFGDGATGSASSPQHTYAAAGTYSVALTVSGPGGTSTETKTDYITVTSPPPVADFAANNRSGYAPLAVVFSDVSAGDIAQRAWAFGDGGTSSATNAVYTYSQPGTYTVKLAVTGPGGTDEEVKNNFIQVLPPPPVAGFTAGARAGSAPLAVQFQDVSSGQISGWSWKFGDGATSNERQPAHTFTQPGSYTVTLTVAGPGGSNTMTKTGYVQVEAAAIIEVGEIEIDDEWQRVDFQRQFSDPIVIAEPMSGNDGDPAVVRIDAVDADGFSIRVQEWNYLDGWHSTETVSYLVMERGRHQLPNGSWVEAGEIATNKTNAFASAPFAKPFATVPVVIAAVTTFNESDTVTTRIRSIAKDRFEVGMQEQESANQVHGVETIAYVAWEPSSGVIDGRRFEVNRTPMQITNNPVTDKPYTLLYKTPFELPPAFLAAMQSVRNRDTANLRWQNKSAQAVGVWVDEEQSRDAETSHPAEVVGYFAFE